MNIYIVPVNYGFRRESGKCVFYFHGAKAGRKYELAGKSPYVGFETDGRYELECGYSLRSFGEIFKVLSVPGGFRLLRAQRKRKRLLTVYEAVRQVKRTGSTPRNAVHGLQFSGLK